MLEELYATIANLVTFPRSGHTRSDLSSRPIRFQLVREYLIAYIPDSKPLVILAFLHGRRSPRIIAAMLKHRM
jgi:plasmid stabilization system protein ParE